MIPVLLQDSSKGTDYCIVNVDNICKIPTQNFYIKNFISRANYWNGGFSYDIRSYYYNMTDITNTQDEIRSTLADIESEVIELIPGEEQGRKIILLKLNSGKIDKSFYIKIDINKMYLCPEALTSAQGINNPQITRFKNQNISR